VQELVCHDAAAFEVDILLGVLSFEVRVRGVVGGEEGSESLSQVTSQTLEPRECRLFVTPLSTLPLC